MIPVAGKAGDSICGGAGALHPQHSKGEEEIGGEGKGGRRNTDPDEVKPAEVTRA